MKNILTFFTLVFGLYLLPTIASASTNNVYVCAVDSLTGSHDGSRGDFGYIYFSYYSAPNCTGTSRGGHVVCSRGATSSSCPSNPAYLFTESQLGNMAQMLQNAAVNGTRIDTNTTTCQGGNGSNCLWYVRFYGY